MNTIETIYNHFGNRAFVMIGAHYLIAPDHRTIRFRFMKSEGTKATMCEIQLNEATDTYTMRFYRRIPAKRVRSTVNGITVSLIREFAKWEQLGEDRDGIFCDNLRETFERATGLFTSL